MSGEENTLIHYFTEIVDNWIMEQINEQCSLTKRRSCKFYSEFAIKPLITEQRLCIRTVIYGNKVVT